MEHRIVHACGHEQAHYLAGFASQQDRKARWLRTTACQACYVEGRRADQAASAADAVAAVADPALVELVGSERQVAWAMTIRAQRIAKLLAGPALSVPISDQRCCHVEDAKWWIDHRNLDDAQLLQAAETFAGRVTQPAIVSRAA